MFSIGFLEMMLVAVVALLVLGPDRLPGAVRETTIWIGRIRRQMNTLRRDFEEQVDDLQNDQAIADLMQGRKLLDEAERDIKKAVAPLPANTSDSAETPHS